MFIILCGNTPINVMITVTFLWPYRYFQNAFMLTNVSGESAEFTFNGTGVQIYGAKRANHGPYHVNLDDSPNTGLSGTAPDPGLFQTSLFSATGLQQGLHRVTITNDGSSYLDIDFITWQTDIGNSSDKIMVNTFQDTDPSFVYSPSDASWSTNPEYLGTFSGGSGHATNSSSALFTYTFQGEGVSLYGPVGPNGSTYDVRLDNNPLATLSSKRQFYKPQSLLYHTNNLVPGLHSLQLQCQSTSSNQVCAIDYADVYATSSFLATLNNHNTIGLSTGVVAGITAAGVVALFVFLGLLGFLWHRHRHQIGSNRSIQQTAPSGAFTGPQSTTGLVPSQMTTVPNPFFLSAPPPSLPHGAPYDNSQRPRKGRVRVNALYVEETSSDLPSESSTFGVNSSTSMLNSTSRTTRPRVLRGPLTPGDGLPPGYSL